MADPNDSTMGILALVMGILGCINILPCIGPILAIIFGGQSRGTQGEGMGKIGRILGWIAVCIIPLGIIIYVILVFTVLGGTWFWTYF